MLKRVCYKISYRAYKRREYPYCCFAMHHLVDQKMVREKPIFLPLQIDAQSLLRTDSHQSWNLIRINFTVEIYLIAIRVSSLAIAIDAT